MDFACESIDVQQVLKCSFGLTKAGCAIMRELIESNQWQTSEQLAETTGYDLATAQRALKHLTEKEVAQRIQQNRDAGGYEYIYKAAEKQKLAKLVETTLDEWTREAKKEVRQWLQHQ